MNDIDIAQAAQPQHINQIAAKLGIDPEQLEHYGKYKAKVPYDPSAPLKGKLILVTAMTPTPAGEGKTTVSIGLCDAMNGIGAHTALALREPSLGPVFGVKGGATGGGYSQVIPMEDINLHFTGDFSAIEKANNLLAALIDNNIQSKSRGLGIDPRTVAWKRVMDMNDRSLRDIVIGLGGTGNGIPRESGFNITAASEVMAILCMATDIEDLKRRFGNIFVGFTFDKKPIYARDINAQGAMAALMKDAIKPNLVQTLDGNPAFIHGGPFANIAQGTNSIIATRTAMRYADYAVTEAGFGSDLGAEKFMDIKCRYAGLSPAVMVVVATIRALKYHGGVPLDQLKEPNADAVARGMANLERHIENRKVYGISAVVAINKFVSDTQEEIDVVVKRCRELGVEAHPVDYWSDGGKGGHALARSVQQHADAAKGTFTPVYPLEMPVEEKMKAIAQKIYGAEGIDISTQARADIARIKTLGLENLPICMAKTQNSLSDDPKALGSPKGFTITIREIEIAAGAGFLVPITGTMMRMPGLPATPASEHIDIDASGNISGLF
jgi:formate--tetrahydrofolate ligase